MKKRIIYDSEGVTYKDAKEILISEGYNADDITDETIFEYMDFYNGEYLNDEKYNLNKTLENDIIVIADLGLWHGHKQGYKILGYNLNSILNCFCGDYIQLYYDGRNVRAKDIHHDGTNHYLFREFKPNINRAAFLNKIYNEKLTLQDISKYTTSLKKYVKEIYGW